MAREQPAHVYIIHDFIKNLPPGQPSPFNEAIFEDSEDRCYTRKTPSGPAVYIKYKNVLAYSTR